MEEKSEIRMDCYEDKNAKASDFKSSAAALLIVGFAGIVFVFMVFMGYIPFKMSLSWKAISCTIMAIFCIFLIVTGFSSIKSFKSILSLAKEEDKITEEISNWYKSVLTKEMIDDKIPKELASSFNDGDLYYARTEIIKEILTNKFFNLDDKYVEHIIEIIYQDIFDD